MERNRNEIIYFFFKFVFFFKEKFVLKQITQKLMKSLKSNQKIWFKNGNKNETRNSNENKIANEIQFKNIIFFFFLFLYKNLLCGQQLKWHECDKGLFHSTW